MQQQQEGTNVVLTSFSQSHVLNVRMRQANLSHGDTVNADIHNVRIEGHHAKAVIYFCPSEIVHVKQFIQKGDGARLPEDAIIIGDLKIPSNFRPGLYHLRDVNLHSNGTLQIIPTEQTYFESAEYHGEPEYRGLQF